MTGRDGGRPLQCPSPSANPVGVGEDPRLRHPETPRPRGISQAARTHDGGSTMTGAQAALPTGQRDVAPFPASPPQHGGATRAALLLGALGVVYGDIGTSPLYA